MLRYLSIALTAILAVLLVLEGTVYMLGLNWRILAQRPDPIVGITYPAGTVVRWSKEGYGVTHYMADGEIATPFNEGMEILVLGDSHTEAYQMDDKYKYVSVAETLLWKRGRRVNLRNLGLSAQSFADYVYRISVLRKRNPPPRAFVVQLNDECFTSSFITESTNFFRKTPNGSLELVHHPPTLSPDVPINPWWSYSKLFDYLQERSWILFEKPKIQKPRTAKAPRTPAAEITASVTAQAQMMSEALGDTPAIFLRTPKWPYTTLPDSAAFFTYQALRKAQRWPLIDPGGALVRSFERTHRDPRTFSNTLPMNAHLNRYGDAVVGQVLADAIEGMFFPPDPARQ